jgi:hypothetical protein
MLTKALQLYVLWFFRRKCSIRIESRLLGQSQQRLLRLSQEIAKLKIKHCPNVPIYSLAEDGERVHQHETWHSEFETFTICGTWSEICQQVRYKAALLAAIAGYWGSIRVLIWTVLSNKAQPGTPHWGDLLFKEKPFKPKFGGLYNLRLTMYYACESTESPSSVLGLPAEVDLAYYCDEADEQRMKADLAMLEVMSL